MTYYNERIEIRLSTKQKEQLMDAIGENDTISKYVRRQLYQSPISSDSSLGIEIRNELQRIGNLLNQIAQSLNPNLLSQNKSLPVVYESNKDLKIIINLLHTLMRKIG